MDRISSLDKGYTTGDLSIFPHAIDNEETLYRASNNASTKLKQSLTYGGKMIIVESTAAFADHGLIRIGPSDNDTGESELIYYGNRTASGFSNLIRGFAGSRQSQWRVGTSVTSGVMAESHNAIKDAVLNIENALGTKYYPDPKSLNGILTSLETRFLAPKPLFRGFPLKGVPPLKVRFQNFTGSEPIRYLWDFGDGTTSTAFSPIHTYQREGIYTVKLNVLTALGAQGIETKSNYVKVSDQEGLTFFYSEQLTGISEKTASQQTPTPGTPTKFKFIDQTDGPIVQRIWSFDDGIRITSEDPNAHTIEHEYELPGDYRPTLIVILESNRLKRVQLDDVLRVT